ncbi:MAG: hypothetical protein PHS53_03280 [Candidatus Pacebacteria bacterium]|nr:hypothetical protein [Candidatus Paceibacterota bacterium]
MLLWWLTIFNRGIIDTTENYLFGGAIGVLTVIGGIVGLIKAKRWGGFRSSTGKSVIFLSTGLLTWAIGTLIFAYYNLFLDIAVPYPSLADVAYIVSWPLWTIGILYLSPAIGLKYQLKKMSGKVFLLIIPLVTIFLSYYLLFVIGRGGVIDLSGGSLKLFFDLAYPIGDIVILSITALVYSLSFNYLGGFFKFPIIVIMLGFVLNYLADFSFSYTTTQETFDVANWNDLLFTTAMFVLSVGLSLFDPHLLNKTEK